MRHAVLLGMAVIFAACTTKEAPPADTAAVADSLPPGKSLGAIAAIWDVNVMPLDKDSVLTCSTRPIPRAGCSHFRTRAP
jgi:predicted lipoprotein